MEEVQLVVFYTYWNPCVGRQMDSTLRLVYPVLEAEAVQVLSGRGGCGGGCGVGLEELAPLRNNQCTVSDQQVMEDWMGFLGGISTGSSLPVNSRGPSRLHLKRKHFSSEYKDRQSRMYFSPSTPLL